MVVIRYGRGDFHRTGRREPGPGKEGEAMSEQTIRELQQLLGAGDREVGFLEYLPATAADALLRASREAVDAEDAALAEAIANGTRALPMPLDRIAHGILG